MSKHMLEILKKEYEEFDGEFEETFSGDTVNFILVEEGDWEVDCKWQFQETIVKDRGDNYYGIMLARTGSYHSDYYYEDPEFYEVVPEVITKTIYKRMK